MRAYLLPPGIKGDRPFVAPKKDARYLLRVLRLSEGDVIPAMDQDGRSLELRIGAEAGEGLTLVPIPREKCPAIPGSPNADAAPVVSTAVRSALVAPFRITLYQCVSKGQRMDTAVRMAAEAGVARIVPLLSSRSVARTQQDGARAQRWARIVKEARQQSGSRTATEIAPVMDIADATADWAGRGPAIFFHERPLAETGLHGYLNDAPPEAAALVGPEGGLSDAETDTLLGAGWLPAWLGPETLRTETAAIYAVAALQTIVRERRFWLLNRDSRRNG